MIPFIAMVITGLLFGYLIVSPFNRGYTALQWAGVMLVCGSAYGVLIVVALTLTAGTGHLNPGQPLIAAGFCIAYALASAVGVYIHERREGK